MPLKPYACANCGFWQRWFDVPPACPVCTDVRNALPPDGWDFVPVEAMAERVSCSWVEHDGDLLEFRTDPRFGLDSVGWLLLRDDGNVGFEAAAWYSDEALQEIERRGGISMLSASHPHGYGAMWQLQDHFDAPLAVTLADHAWTKALHVQRPYDDTLALRADLVLHRTGGHFDGHAVLHDAANRRLFAGDAVKFDVDEGGWAAAVSCHQAWHQQTPLTHGEIRRYRQIIAPLDFDTVCSPFALAHGATTADVVTLFDAQLAGVPTVEPMEVSA